MTRLLFGIGRTKRKRIRIGSPVAALVLPILLCSAEVHASAWPQPEGEWFVLASSLVESADRFRDGDGALVDGPRFSKFQFKPLVEYGLHRSLTLGLSPDFQRMERDGVDTDAAGGLAAIEVFGRGVLGRTANAVASAQVMLMLPGGFDAATPFLATGASSIGDRFGAEVRLLAGQGGLLRDGLGFVDLQIALRTVGAPAQDEFRYDLTAGWGDPRDWLVLGQLFGIDGLGGARAPAVDFDLLKARFGITRGLRDDLAVELAVERAIDGHDTVAGGAIVVGLWWWP